MEPPLSSRSGRFRRKDAVDRAAADAGQSVDAVDAEPGRMGLANEGVALLVHLAPPDKVAFGLLDAHRHNLERYMCRLMHSNDPQIAVLREVFTGIAAFDTCIV